MRQFASLLLVSLFPFAQCNDKSVGGKREMGAEVLFTERVVRVILPKIDSTTHLAENMCHLLTNVLGLSFFNRSPERPIVLLDSVSTIDSGRYYTYTGSVVVAVASHEEFESLCAEYEFTYSLNCKEVGRIPICSQQPMKHYISGTDTVLFLNTDLKAEWLHVCRFYISTFHNRAFRYIAPESTIQIKCKLID